ncbi:alpha/beta hydrolase [Actinospongicola halichondriae]|uniref:alpha/beta hydrolase n=1 Tax=Actinospongicola halichondriae TaxID=3236844 RepID=UPI003D49D143
MSTTGTTLGTRTGRGGTSDEPETPATIVFVHGAWHGPWCWEQWSAEARRSGYPTASITLPAHDRPGSRKRIWPRMGSYLAHVRTVVDSIDGPVVVVGHSMGGYVTQRILEDRPSNLVGVVLVASVPRRGVAGATSRLLRHSPGPTIRALLTADLFRVCHTETLARRAFFCADTDDGVVRAAHARIQNESYLVFPPMLARFTRPGVADVPVMVLAAQDDGIFSVRSQRRLAKAYGTKLQLVPGGHDVMLDVAADGSLHLVLDWVRQTIR